VLDHNGHQIMANADDSAAFCASVLRGPMTDAKRTGMEAGATKKK
jgi:hypothetical protein